MNKIGEFISSIDKLAFVPAPGVQESQDLMQQVTQMVQSAPPEVQQQVTPMLQQIQQLPPDQQTQALQQLGEQLSQAQGGEQGGQSNGGKGQPGSGSAPIAGEGTSDGLETKVTITVRELLDFVSGGKATQSQLKIQQLMQKQDQQAQQQAQQQQQQQEQQAAMAQQAGGPMGAPGGGPGGGIYPQQPQQ